MCRKLLQFTKRVAEEGCGSKTIFHPGKQAKGVAE